MLPLFHFFIVGSHAWSFSRVTLLWSCNYVCSYDKTSTYICILVRKQINFLSINFVSLSLADNYVTLAQGGNLSCIPLYKCNRKNHCHWNGNHGFFCLLLKWDIARKHCRWSQLLSVRALRFFSTVLNCTNIRNSNKLKQCFIAVQFWITSLPVETVIMERNVALGGL